MKYFILIAILLVNPVFGKTLELKKSSRSIFIEELKNWKLGKDLFGMPFVYFSPTKNGERSNISFTDTGVNLALEIKALASNQNDYQSSRRAWAKKVGADPLSFYPYQVKINNKGHRVHGIGFSYQFGGKVYDEKSYYIECRGRILFSKSLHLKTNASHEKDFAALINSIDCGGA